MFNFAANKLDEYNPYAIITLSEERREWTKNGKLDG